MVKTSIKLRTLREIIKVFNKRTQPKVQKWLNGSAEYGYTTVRNENIFRSIGIIPQVLKNFKSSNSNCSFFGTQLSSPIIIAPMGGITTFNKKAQLIISDASEKYKIPYFFPNSSSYTLSELNPKLKKKYLNYALYLDSDLDYCKEIIEEAEKFNCKTITISVDCPVRSVSYNKTDTGYDGRKHYKKMNLKLPKKYFRKKIGSPLSWKHIELIRKMTKKPIILKGILSKNDAKTAENLGVNALWVSNHGGRNLETDITSLEVIEGIRNKISPKMKLIADGGIRTGSDIFKTLALGADFVSVGRPIVYGLVADPKSGVSKVLELLSHEFNTTMRISGTETLKDINKSFIINRLDRLK